MLRQPVLKIAFRIRQLSHSCGEGGIRTRDTLTSIPAFQAGSFDHSDISPFGDDKSINFLLIRLVNLIRASGLPRPWVYPNPVRTSVWSQRLQRSYRSRSPRPFL